MKRDIYSSLLEWKASEDRKPLLLRGARQVGKTYILQQLASQSYQNSVYLNFEKHKRAHLLFEDDLDPARIVRDLRAYSGKDILPGDTLIIFDEIQECPHALNSLKYFCEEARQYHIAAAGSLLGVKLANTEGFPVGKVNFLDLFPLSFFEFLDAIDKSQYRKLLEKLEKINPITSLLHEELIGLLKQYFFIGGMPEAIKQFVKMQDYRKVREIQKAISRSFIF